MSYQYLNKINNPSDIKCLTSEQLNVLAQEIRDYIIKTVSKTGGHLASNLGVVELTIAMHLAFDSPNDKLIFDVSHQSYVHKLLTGRFADFKSLRQYGGISGFIKRKESSHDIFEAGHASTSLSAAIGLAKARDLKGKEHAVVALIGDGALSGGMAYEALNNIGHDKSKVIIVLNDNEMSISKNVGGITNHLAKIRTNPNYYRAKADVHQVIEKVPAIGKALANGISKFKGSLKQFLVPGMLFEELGLTYLGLIDGHNINTLKETMIQAKNVEGPVLIHVKTQKGKGYQMAEVSPEAYHGVSAFDIVTGKGVSEVAIKSFSTIFGETLIELAKDDQNICAITAAMPSGTGLDAFSKTYPKRYYDVGIAEGHAVTFAAGLAVGGVKPFFVVYSTFLQRGYDQIIHDVCIQNLPVTFCIDRAGLVGNDGETHHGIFDLSFLLSIPNMHVMVPKDGTDLRTMLKHATTYQHPLAIRYPRGSAYSYSKALDTSLEPEVTAFGDDFYIVAIGRMHHHALKALQLLKQKGINGKLITPKRIKPLNIEVIIKEIKGDLPIFTIEENVRNNGFGSYFVQRLKDEQVFAKVYNLGIPDYFVAHGDMHDLFKDIHLTPEAITIFIEDVLSCD